MLREELVSVVDHLPYTLEEMIPVIRRLAGGGVRVGTGGDRLPLAHTVLQSYITKERQSRADLCDLRT